MEEDLKLSELVSVETLDHIRSVLLELTGVPTVFTNADGTLITDIQIPLRYCASLVCAEGAVCLRREKWDVPEPEIEREMRACGTPEEPIHHWCPGGFSDTAVPVIVQDRIVGHAVFARSLPEEPDIQRFRQLAVEGNMPAETGEQVANAALVMPAERIDQVAELLRVLAQLVTSAAYDTIRAEQIMELEEQRDALTHMIVHDLRTPLTSIIGGLQTVADTDYEDDITREFVPSALASAEDLLAMVNTLLDINKMESGKLELDVEPIDFAQIADQAYDQVAGLAREHEHEIRMELDEDCPAVPADPEKLRRVIVNLLGNAIKFTPSGGKIKLMADCSDEELTFSVIDNGPGIPKEDRERIFDKFGQARTRQEGHKYSTGLGLTFCKMIAEAHGGTIWVESEVGEGSTFSVAVPLDTTAGDPDG